MKFLVVWLLVLIMAGSVMADTVADVRATTEDGAAVILHDDGTWESASVDKSLRLDLGEFSSSSDVAATTLIPCVVTEVLGGNHVAVRIDSPPYVLSSKETVRLLGIEAAAPESLESYSYESYRYLRERILGSTVYLGFDNQLRDSDGALLAYLYSDKSVCLNAVMLGRS